MRTFPVRLIPVHPEKRQMQTARRSGTRQLNYFFCRCCRLVLRQLSQRVTSCGMCNLLSCRLHGSGGGTDSFPIARRPCHAAFGESPSPAFSSLGLTTILRVESRPGGECGHWQTIRGSQPCRPLTTTDRPTVDTLLCDVDLGESYGQ